MRCLLGKWCVLPAKDSWVEFDGTPDCIENMPRVRHVPNRGGRV